MGHRQTFNSPWIFEHDGDQGTNHAEQPYLPMARVSASENSSLILPVDTMPVQGGHFTSLWNSAPRSNGYSSSIVNSDLPHYPLAPCSSSHGPFLHQSAPGNFLSSNDNHPRHSSSDNTSGQTVPADDYAFFPQTMGSGRGKYKRKSHGNLPVGDMGSSSRYYDVGSSSCAHLSADHWEEKQNAESYNRSWDYPPNYRAYDLSIGNEGTMRNVRSRTSVGLKTNVSRTHFPCNSMHDSFSSQFSDRSNYVDSWSQNYNSSTWESNHSLTIPPVPSVARGSDSNYFNRRPYPVNVSDSHPNGSIEFGSNNISIISNRDPIPQNMNSNSYQPNRGGQSGYGHRPVPSFVASSSNFRTGCTAASNEGIHIVSDGYPSRYRRPIPPTRMHNIDRDGRTLIQSDRHRSSMSFHDQETPEGLVVSVHHYEPYGSRYPFDQLWDMRLDTENMSYEELLALGDGIGSVCTGVSDDSLSKCLTSSIYCSSDTFEDAETCVICLEEYRNMDDVGSLKACGHDFHVGCIRKWLSMKNLCPICKATALDDNMKNK